MSYPNLNITANGTQKLSLAPGEWAFQVAGTFGSGTLAIKWTDGENVVAYPDASFTAAGGVVVAVGAADVVIALSGATNPDLNLRVAKI